MKYQVIKLTFSGTVHFGTGILESGIGSFCADTLFSALCLEALSQEGETGIEALKDAVKSGRLVISDAFPFFGEELYLPKPTIPVQSKQISDDADSSARKQFKKLKYLPVSALDSYLSGTLSPEECRRYTDQTDAVGTPYLQTNVRIYENRSKDPEPYYVGGYRFRENCGLWVLLGAEESDTKKMISLFCSLGITGIGGKISSGFGRFTVSVSDPDFTMKSMLEENTAGTWMTLSICLPNEAELERVIEKASYAIVKRGGFIASETYAEKAQKKNDLFMLTAGSCFSERFHGDVYDVSAGGAHPVYQYGVPLLLRVR